MSPETVLTLFGFVIALLALTPRRVQLDVRTRLRRLDWIIVLAAGLAIFALVMRDTILWFVPSLREYEWSFGLSSSTVGFLILISVSAFLSLRISFASLAQSRLELFRQLANELCQAKDYSSVSYLIARNLGSLRRLSALETSGGRSANSTNGVATRVLQQMLEDREVVRYLVVTEPQLCEELLFGEHPKRFMVQWLAASLETQQSALMRELAPLECQYNFPVYDRDDPAYVIDDSTPLLRKLLREWESERLALGSALRQCLFDSLGDTQLSIRPGDESGLLSSSDGLAAASLKLFTVALADRAYFSKESRSRGAEYLIPYDLIVQASIVDDDRKKNFVKAVESVVDTLMFSLVVAVDRNPQLGGREVAGSEVSERVFTVAEAIGASLGEACAALVEYRHIEESWESMAMRHMVLVLRGWKECPARSAFANSLVEQGASSVRERLPHWRSSGKSEQYVVKVLEAIFARSDKEHEELREMLQERAVTFRWPDEESP